MIANWVGIRICSVPRALFPRHHAKFKVTPIVAVLLHRTRVVVHDVVTWIQSTAILASSSSDLAGHNLFLLQMALHRRVLNHGIRKALEGQRLLMCLENGWVLDSMLIVDQLARVSSPNFRTHLQRVTLRKRISANLFQWLRHQLIL